MMVFIRWIATFSGIAGALLIASNVSVSKYSFLFFLFFLVSGLLWGVAAYSIKDYALLLLQTVFVTIDTYGVFRWLM